VKIIFFEYSLLFSCLLCILFMLSIIQVRGFHREDSEDDSDDEFSDDEELQTPIDEVDPFIFFVETIQALQASDPGRFQNLMQTLDFHYQALANGVAQHAEERKTEIAKEKLEKANAQ